MAGLLVSAGCWGRGSDKQPRPIDLPKPYPEKLVVIAHLADDLILWRDLFAWTHEIHVIVMVRDPWVQRKSRAKASGQPTGVCRMRYEQDYKASFKFIANHSFLFTLVPYEALIKPGSPERILSLFGLEQKEPLMVQDKFTNIRDENRKWYGST